MQSSFRKFLEMKKDKKGNAALYWSCDSLSPTLPYVLSLLVSIVLVKEDLNSLNVKHLEVQNFITENMKMVSDLVGQTYTN